MEFTLADFTNRIHQVLYDNFPYENDIIDIKKHKNRPLHIRDIALMPPMENDGALVFEIGSEYAEENYPYYHILENAPFIRKRNPIIKNIIWISVFFFRKISNVIYYHFFYFFIIIIKSFIFIS